MRPALATTCLLAACSAPRSAADLAAARWEPSPTGVTASLRGLSPVDAWVCWVSGSGGTVLCTTDGGATWSPCPVPGAEDLDFRDVQAFDADHALVLSAGQPARVYATADGGASWRLVHESPHGDAFFDSFAFFDRQRGVAFSDPVDGRFLVLCTDDGGASWREVPREVLPAPLPGEAGFAASGTCVAVAGSRAVWIGTGGGAARVLRSSDRGAHWEASTVPVLAGAPSQGVFSVAFSDARHGVAVGGDYREPERGDGTAAWTGDGGSTWRPASSPPRGYRSCAAAVPRMAGVFVAVGTSGADLSSDGGRTWRPLPEAGGWHAVAFSADGAGWAAGAGGRVARLRW